MWIFWFLTLKQEHRLRVLENKVLRKIFEPKKAGGWRRLQNKELQKFCRSANNIRVNESRRMRCGGNLACIGKPECKRPLEKPRRRWEDNLRMDLQKIGLKIVERDSSGSG
jgi:hypothetical protein